MQEIKGIELLSREKVLYRILTLNTGQIPMSVWHQIEVNYIDDEDGEWFMELLKRMDIIKVNAKKIGNMIVR